MNAEQKSLFKQLSEKISLELVFAEAGKDAGLLPINSLLCQIEELPLASAGEVWVDAIKLARKWIDRVFDTTATFDELTLRLLGEWGAWAQNVGDAWLTGGTIPPVPAHWSTAVAASAPAAATTAAAAAEPSPVSNEAQAPLVMNIDSDGDLLREFTNESQEHLQNIEQGVLVLEENPKDRDTLNSIFRAFHTFKGGSGLLNLMPMNRTAHELENLLDLARQDKLQITSDIINLILEGGDVLKQFIDEMNAQLTGKNPPGPIIVQTKDLLTRVRAAVTGSKIPAAQVAAGSSAPSAPPPAAAAPAAPVPAPEAAGSAASASPAAGASAAKAAAPAGGAVVKVDTLKLDSLVDLVGEMVIAQSMVQLDPEVARLSNQNLNRNLAQLGRITKELQRIAMSMRMVPIRPTFQKMNRLVRDVCAKQGKQVELILVGEDTELDRTIVEEISDPLVHMIRNAVDHGIEVPDVRTKAGKPAQGTIHLSAYHQGGNIVIQIKDDGGGLRKDRILKKAVEKGILRPDQTLPDKEIFDLIFAPGFSTAEKVTDISGRGVGMDVVKRNIEKLRGKVEIDSVEGKGSVFNIYLPLTLAIIDGLIISIGNERYILPTLSVRESFRPTAQMLSTVHERGEMVNVRGRLYPLLRLYEAFNIKPQTENPEESIVIVIEAGQDVRCLLVDQLLGKQEVVIKSLGETFKANPAIAGAAILGDGRVGLILDVNTLVRIRQMTPQAKAA